jgi:hypothetical protein
LRFSIFGVSCAGLRLSAMRKSTIPNLMLEERLAGGMGGSPVTTDDSSMSPTGGLFFSILQQDCFRYPSLGISVPVHFLQRKWQGQQGRVLAEAEASFLLKEVFDLCLSVPSFNLGLQKWLEMRERVQGTLTQLHSDPNGVLQEHLMMELIGNSPGSYFLMRWFMDQRVLRQSVSGYLAKVHPSFERPKPNNKTANIFHRLLFGAKETAGFFDDVAIVGSPEVVAGLLIVLANSELSAGKTNEAIVRIGCALELLDLVSRQRQDASSRSIHLLGVQTVEALLTLQRAAGFLLDKRIQLAAGLKAFELYVLLPKKAEEAQFVRLPAQRRKNAQEAAAMASAETEEEAVAAGLVERYGNTGLHRYRFDYRRMVANSNSLADPREAGNNNQQSTTTSAPELPRGVGGEKIAIREKLMVSFEAGAKNENNNNASGSVPMAAKRGKMSLGGDGIMRGATKQVSNSGNGNNAFSQSVRAQFMMNQQLKKLSPVERTFWESPLWIRLLLDRGTYLKTEMGDNESALFFWLKAFDACIEETTAKDDKLFDMRELTLQLRLNYVLQTPKVRELFKLFCVQTYCDENLDCWTNIETFASVDAIEQNKLKEMAVEIWNEFIVEAAERPVNITADVRKFLKERIFGEKLLNPFVFQEAQRSLEALMGGEILKHFFTSNLFRVNVSREEMTSGIQDIFLESKSKIAQQTFLEEDFDFLFLDQNSETFGQQRVRGVEKRVMMTLPHMGKNIFACTVGANALTVLQEEGVFGSSESVTFANRLLACSLNLGSLLYMCSAIIPRVADLLKCDAKLRRRIYDHAASFYAAFNNINKVELCANVLEEILLLRGKQRSSDLDRLLVLNRATGLGYQLRLSALLLEAALQHLVRKPFVACQRIMVSFNILLDFALGKNNAAPPSNSVISISAKSVSVPSSKTTSRVPSAVGLPSKVRADSVFEELSSQIGSAFSASHSRSDSVFEKEGQMSQAFGDLFLLQLRLLIALDSIDLRAVLNACDEVRIPPFDHLLLLELAKYYDSVGELELAHSRFQKCVISCNSAPMNQHTADACAYSLLRLAQMRKDSQMLNSCRDFILNCGFPDRLNLLAQCVVPPDVIATPRPAVARVGLENFFASSDRREETKENREEGEEMEGDKWSEVVRIANDKQKEELE